MSWRARRRAIVERRQRVYGINRRNVELVYAHNQRRHYPIADDKLLCKEHLERAGVPTPPTLAVCDGLFAIPRTLASLPRDGQFVIKPANGSGGDGILVVGERVDDDHYRLAGGRRIGLEDLHRHLAEVVLGAYSRQLDDRAFVERRVIPHAFFHELWPHGLCDVRVITLRGTPVIAMIRVPTVASEGRANLHQGGVGLAVELATGRTFRAVRRGAAIPAHPESGTPLIGMEVPHWDEILDVATRAARAVPLGYLGCDVIVDAEAGPRILEINARPGLEIQNVNGFGLGHTLVAKEHEA